MINRLEEFRKLLASNSEKPKEIYSRVISNLDFTQKKIIQYRKLIAVYSAFYYLAVFDHLNLVFINQYLKISQENPFFSIDSVERLIIIVAPMFLAILYYLMILAKFHRGLIYVFINKYNKSEYVSFMLTHPYSAGLVRGFFNRINNKEKHHIFNKYVELFFYILTILLSVVLMIYFLVKDFSYSTLLFVVISNMISIIVLIKTKKEVNNYLRYKNELINYELF